MSALTRGFGRRLALVWLGWVWVPACGLDGVEPEGFGSGPRRGTLAEGAFDPLAAPLVYTSDETGDPEVWIRERGTRPKNLTQNPASDSWATVSRSGERIVFQSDRAGALDLWTMTRAGGDARRLTWADEPEMLPALSPAADRVAYLRLDSSGGDGPGELHLYLLDLSDGGSRRITDDPLGVPSPLDWMPDGGGVAFARRRAGGGADLFLWSARDGSETLLVHGAGELGAPAFSPDGERLAFQTDYGATSEITVLELSGMTRRAVVARGQSWDPRWSGDGRWLAYTTRTRSRWRRWGLNLAVTPVDGPQPTEWLFRGEGNQNGARWVGGGAPWGSAFPVEAHRKPGGSRASPSDN